MVKRLIDLLMAGTAMDEADLREILVIGVIGAVVIVLMIETIVGSLQRR